MLELILALSLIINIVSFMYSRYLIKQLSSISIDLVLLRNIMFAYRENLTLVYESEMFYGEPTLESLVAHTTAVSSDIEELFLQYDFEEVDSLQAEEAQN